jgi:hypothetical protein
MVFSLTLSIPSAVDPAHRGAGLGRRRQQAVDRLPAASARNDSDGLVFTSRWGDPCIPIP